MDRRRLLKGMDAVPWPAGPAEGSLERLERVVAEAGRASRERPSAYLIERMLYRRAPSS